MTGMIPPRILRNGWTDERSYTRDPRRLPAVADNPWRPCPGCWGQGRWYSENLYDYTSCGTCLGVGSVPSVTR